MIGKEQDKFKTENYFNQSQRFYLAKFAFELLLVSAGTLCLKSIVDLKHDYFLCFGKIVYKFGELSCLGLIFLTIDLALSVGV